MAGGGHDQPQSGILAGGWPFGARRSPGMALRRRSTTAGAGMRSWGLVSLTVSNYSLAACGVTRDAGPRRKMWVFGESTQDAKKNRRETRDGLASYVFGVGEHGERGLGPTLWLLHRGEPQGRTTTCKLGETRDAKVGERAAGRGVVMCGGDARDKGNQGHGGWPSRTSRLHGVRCS